MSYDLHLVGDDRLDLERARAALAASGEAAGDELLWERDTLSATFLLTPEEIDVGIVSGDAPTADRARELEELLRLVLRLAGELGARVHDPQLGRDLRPDDIAAAVHGFA